MKNNYDRIAYLALSTLAVLLLFAASVSAAEWHVSPNGSQSNSGTSVSGAWNLPFAFSGANGAIKPGDTVWIHGGIYQPAQDHTDGVAFKVSAVGGPSAPIIFKAYQNERPIIQAADTSEGNILDLAGSYYYIWGLEVRCTNTQKTTSSSGSWPPASDVPCGYVVAIDQDSGTINGVKLINNVFHGGQGGVGLWPAGINIETYGNIIYHNGWRAPDRPHGHGIYVQNNDLNNGKKIFDNIVFNNFDNGMQLYGESANLYNVDIEGNIFFNNGEDAGLEGSNAIYIGNPATNSKLINNIGYNHNKGYGATISQNDNFQISGNYFASGGDWGVQIQSQGTGMVTNNIAYGLSGFPGNNFFGSNGNVFYQAGNSAPTYTLVRQNIYDPNRVNIFILNWNKANSVSVNLPAGFLSSGNNYELHNAQDYYNDIKSGTYSGGQLSIDMQSTSHSVVPLIINGNTVSMPSSFPILGAFVLVKTSGSNTCTSTCSSLGYACGTQNICGTSTSCGSCPSGQSCSASGTCTTNLPQCTNTCSSLGFTCGQQTICGLSTNCGTCPTGQSCNAAGKCIAINGCQDSCSNKGFTCGTQTLCGTSVNCGTCSNLQTCYRGQCINNLQQNSTCTETDNGLDYFTRGTVTTSLDGIDYCIYPDICTNSQTLKEYYCTNGIVNTTNYVCTNGCVNGRCNPANNNSCTDTCSSKGFNCGTQNICGASINCGSCGNGQSCSAGVCQNDICSSGQKCYNSTAYGIQSANCIWTGITKCSGSCSNGQCINAPPTCIDTCSSKGFACGTQTVCGSSTNCGGCASGKTCSSGQCINSPPACTDTCSSKGFNCGTQTICGTSVNCGGCQSTQTCSSGTCITLNNNVSTNFNCDYYASPKGSASSDMATSSGAGTLTSPWSLQTALSQGNMAGKTICLMPGTYYGSFQATLSGTSSNPVILRNYKGQRATIDDQTSSHTYIISIKGSYIWLWGIEIMSDAPLQLNMMSDAIQFDSGVTDNKIINCIIHDAGGAGISNEQGPLGTEVYGTMMYYNGRSPYDYGNGNGNYGTYTQNIGSENKIYQDDYVFYNWLYGIHMYTQTAAIDNFLFDGNALFNNGYFRDYCQTAVRTASTSCGAIGSSFERNFLSGGLPANNLRFTNNYMYYSASPTAGARETIGFNQPAASPVISGNYFIRGVVDINANNVNPTGNTFYANSFEGISPSTTSNTYLSSPSGINYFVRPNKYEPGNRANIIIYNWNKASSVNIEISNAGLTDGSNYAIYDSLNYYGSPVTTGTYHSGQLVNIPMNEKTYSVPVGQSIPPMMTEPEFGAFILIKTSANNNPTCTDTCNSKGFTCGTQNICGTNINCGSCTGAQTCNAGKCTTPNNNTQFIVLQRTYFTSNRPTDAYYSSFGIKPMAVIYAEGTGGFGCPPNNQVQTQAAAQAYQDVGYGHMVFLNDECKGAEQFDANVVGSSTATANMQQMRDTINWFKSAAVSGLKVGVYSYAPLPTNIHFSGAGDYNQATYQGLNNIIQPVADSEDFLSPSIYSTYANVADWEWEARVMIGEAKRLAKGKPVYAFISPQYYMVSSQSGMVSHDYWKGVLETVKDAGADGALIFVWGDDSGGPTFDPNSGWWTATKEFMASNNQTI